MNLENLFHVKHAGRCNGPVRALSMRAAMGQIWIRSLSVVAVAVAIALTVAAIDADVNAQTEREQQAIDNEPRPVGVVPYPVLDGISMAESIECTVTPNNDLAPERVQLARLQLSAVLTALGPWKQTHSELHEAVLRQQRLVRDLEKTGPTSRRCQALQDQWSAENAKENPPPLYMPPSASLPPLRSINPADDIREAAREGAQQAIEADRAAHPTVY